MKAASATRIWTDDELMALDSKDGRKHELWHGKKVKFELLGEGRNLTGNAVLPGFRLAIARLFDDPAFS